MYIPEDGDFVKYTKYTVAQEIDVLYRGDDFYLGYAELLNFFKCDEVRFLEVLSGLFLHDNKKSVFQLQVENSPQAFCYSLDAISEIGNTLNTTETERFVEWAGILLMKYSRQKNGKRQYMQDIQSDFLYEVQSLQELDCPEGVSIEILTAYLNLIGKRYQMFVGRLNEVEQNDSMSLSDIDFLDQIDLCFVDRYLEDKASLEFGRNIESTIYKATLERTLVDLRNYFGYDSSDNWYKKIDDLKVKVIRWNVECKQMFYLLKRFGYFSERLESSYRDIVEPSLEQYYEPEFNFWDLVADTSMLPELVDRRKAYVDAKIHVSRKLIEEDFNGKMKSECENYIKKCENSIELIDFEISQSVYINKNQNIGAEPIKESNKTSICIASKKKTDVIKILSAMYDARIFADTEGNLITNKQKMMETFGEFLGEDFSAYSTLLSQAKTRDEKTFMKPFRDIEKEARKYLEEE